MIREGSVTISTPMDDLLLSPPDIPFFNTFPT